VPAHKQEYMRELAGELYLPVREKHAKEVVPLPVHPQVIHGDLETNVADVNKV